MPKGDKMKDCFKHYKEMYETRIGVAECPWCKLESKERGETAAEDSFNKSFNSWYKKGLYQHVACYIQALASAAFKAGMMAKGR
jgi:hypothetical protein